MQRIVPCIWFDHTAVEATQAYTQIFDDADLGVMYRYPESGLLDFQQEFAGQPLTIDFSIGGQEFTTINAGSEFRPNPAISFMVHFRPSQEASLERIWNRLGEGGKELMALDAYPFSPRYGWVEDRYGVSWQLTTIEEDSPPVPAVVPSLMFTEAALGRAADAMDVYTTLFGGGVTALHGYAEPTGIAEAGAIQFASFTLFDQTFAAMDTPVEHGYTFTPGLSLMVLCRDQEEIDRYWETLSAVPEAEQCGWCVDEFGVSWQIIPENFTDYMEKPGAYQKMLEMKKIEIAGFD